MISILIFSCVILPSLTSSFTFLSISNNKHVRKKTSLSATNKKNSKKSSNSNKRLIDVLIEKGNPELQHIHMPFIEPLGNNYIDCKMIFGINVNDIPYIIATPHDSSVAICYTTEEESEGKYVFLKPEDNEMKDIFPIAKSELSKLCSDLQLKNTPRTLTISGDLNKYMDNAWAVSNKVTTAATSSTITKKNGDDNGDNKSIEMDPMTKLLIEELSKENTEEDEQYFEETMKKALGDKYTSSDNDDDDDFLDNIDPKLLDLFNSDAGDISNLKDDEIKSLLKEMFLEENLNPPILDNATDGDTSAATSMYELRKEAVAEKLLSFKCNDKTYSLVHKLEPTIIIGRDDPTPSFANSRKLLVTYDEMNYILPQIEELCVGEFEKYGILPS